jgi:O-antigen/teichoic acid export membrane protein
MATVDSLVEPPATRLSAKPAPVADAAPRKLLGRASMAGAGAIYQQGVAFLSGLVVARVLGAAEYGVFSLARNLVDTTTIITRLGLDIGLQRHFGESSGASAQAMRLVVLRQLRMVAALTALLPIAIAWLGLGNLLEKHVYHHAGFANVLLCLALALPFVTDLGVLGGAYRGSLRPARSIIAESVLVPTARLLLIVVLFMAGWRLWAVAVGTTLGALVGSAWLAWCSRRDFPVPAVHLQSWEAARRVIRYSTVMSLAVLVITLTATMDLLMVGRYVPAEQLGQYSLAKTLLALIGFFSTAFGQTLGALVAERYFSGDHAGLMRVMSQVTRWITLGTLPVFAVFVVWGAQVMLLFGPSFTVSPAVIGFLAAGQFCLAIFGCMGWTLSMTNRHMVELGILVLGLVVAIVLSMLVIPAHGQLGAAIASFCAMAFVNGARVWYARRVLHALPFDASLPLNVAVGLGLAFGARFLVAQLGFGPVVACVAGIGLFTAAYACVCWVQLRDELPWSGKHAGG